MRARSKAKRVAGWSALLILFAGQAIAQDRPSALGRISYGDALRPGGAICTGVLVAPDLVLTARHCVEGARAKPATMRFAADFSQGQSAALRRGAEVILPSEAVTPSRANDVALLRLQTAIDPEVVPPISLAPLFLAQGALSTQMPKLSVIAYRRDAPEQAERQDDCRLVVALSGVLALSCPVVSGNSGAPVLLWDGTDWRVIAVMVAAYSLGQTHSLAALVPPDLVTRLQAQTPP